MSIAWNARVSWSSSLYTWSGDAVIDEARLEIRSRIIQDLFTRSVTITDIEIRYVVITDIEPRRATVIDIEERTSTVSDLEARSIQL